MVRKGLVLFCLGMLLQSMAWGQRIYNIQPTQEGQSIRITYTLESEYNCNVSAFVSTDNGFSWLPMLAVEGDIGSKIKPGNNSFVWRVTQDRENLIGETIKFKVLADEILVKVSDLTNFSKYTANYNETKMFRNNGLTHYQGINSIPSALFQQGSSDLENSAVSVMGSGIYQNMRASTLNATTYINGIPVTNQMTGSALEWIDPMMVDEISVSPQVNGPENSSGQGTVNIKLAKPQTDGLAFATTNSAASFGGFKTMNQVTVGNAKNFVVATSNFTQNRGFMENEFGKKNQYSLHGSLGNLKVRHSFFINNYLFRSTPVGYISLDQLITNPQQSSAVMNTLRSERFSGGYGLDMRMDGDWRVKVGMSWSRSAFGNYYSQYDMVLDSNVEKHNITDEYRSFVQRIEVSKRFKSSTQDALTITVGEEGQLNNYRNENFVNNLQASFLVPGLVRDSYVSGSQFAPFVRAQVDSKRWNRVGAYLSLGKNSNSWYAKYENENSQIITLDEFQLSSPLNAKFGGYAQINDNMQVNGQLSWGYQQPFELPGNLQNEWNYVAGDLSRHEIGVKGSIAKGLAYDLTLYRSNQTMLLGLGNNPSEEVSKFTAGGLEFGAKYQVANYLGNTWTFFSRGNIGNLKKTDLVSNEEFENTGVPRNKMFFGAQFDSDNITLGLYDYWRSKIHISPLGTEWVEAGHEINTFVSIHSKQSNSGAFISLDLGVNNILNTKLPMTVNGDFPNLIPAPTRNYFANICFNANLSGMDGSTNRGYYWSELNNVYFEFKNFTGNSPMTAAYGVGVQGHWPGNNDPVTTSSHIFYGLASNDTEFYTRLFAIPDGEISTNGTPSAFIFGQNVEFALINRSTKFTVGTGASLNIYSTAEPSTYDYSYGYLFVDKLFLVSPGVDFSANLYIDGAVTLGVTYSKCGKIDLTNDDSNTTNYLYSERVDLSNWSFRLGFAFN